MQTLISHLTSLDLLDDASNLFSAKNKAPDFSSWRTLFFQHLKARLLEKISEKQKLEIEQKIQLAKQAKAKALFQKPKTQVFSPTKSFNEVLKEYNKWRPKTSLFKTTSQQTAFNSQQTIDVIDLPNIPGKILRPITR